MKTTSFGKRNSGDGQQILTCRQKLSQTVLRFIENNPDVLKKALHCLLALGTVQFFCPTHFNDPTFKIVAAFILVFFMKAQEEDR